MPLDHYNPICSPEFQLLHAEIHALKLKLEQLEKNALYQKPILDNQEFIQLMKISKRQAQYWRSKGIISFSQVGNKIYYKMEDVMQLILFKAQSNSNRR